MLKITYKEYLKYERLYGKVEKDNKILEVREDEAEYIYDKNNEHDKTFRDILMIKEEALSLINKAIKPQKEIKEEIEDILNKIKNRKEVTTMTLGERIRRNEREEKLRITNEARQEGIEKGKLETIRRMLILKFDDKIIKEVTGAKDKELDKVKKELLEV